ncbi:MAG: hypothetical protein Q6K99_10490 [Thermostichales cyanobacterium BF4_bins_65]
MGLIAKLFKAIFGGIFAFFGILFGGLISSVVGAFQPPAEATVTTPTTTVVDRRAVIDLKQVSLSEVDLSFPRPKRRPGPALDGFRAMAKEVSRRR